MTRKDLQPRVFHLWYYRHFGWENLLLGRVGTSRALKNAGQRPRLYPLDVGSAPHTAVRAKNLSRLGKRSLGRKCATDFRAVVLDIYI